MGREPSVSADLVRLALRPEMDQFMKAAAEILIRAYGNAWKVAEPSDTGALVQRRVVEMEIQGDGKDGYHLIMSPERCFTADTWHETLEEVKDTAQQLFGVGLGEW